MRKGRIFFLTEISTCRVEFPIYNSTLSTSFIHKNINIYILELAENKYFHSFD